MAGRGEGTGKNSRPKKNRFWVSDFRRQKGSWTKEN